MTVAQRFCGVTMLGWRRSLATVALTTALGAGVSLADNVRVLQTNSRDDFIDVIDPATQSIVGTIAGIPVNHGVASAPDGSRLYVSSEAKETLEVVDGKTFAILAEVPLSARPNNIFIGKDGRYVYVGIMGGEGGIDVIDTERLEKVRHIDTHSRVHNVYVTPDGKYLVAGMFGGERNLGVFDIATEQLAWALYEKRNESDVEGVRPIAFETNADGSVKRMFVQISEFHGFTVVDFAERREVARITLPEIPLEQRAEPPFNGAPSHGIGVAPDGKTLWVCSRWNGHVYAYSLPDLAYLGGVAVGSHPDWLTFTPDSRFVYIANGGSNSVSIVDIAARREVKRLEVGKAPKRNLTVRLP
jgi:YVTN family beta-propeller protein